MRKRKGYGASPFAPGNPYVPDNLHPGEGAKSYAWLRAPRDKDDRPGEGGEWIIRRRKL